MLKHLAFTIGLVLAANGTSAVSRNPAQIPLAAESSWPPPPNADGKYTLYAEGINASFIPFSAAITNLFVNDRNGTPRDIVLGFDDAAAYESDKARGFNFGATVGRYANRIVNHTYELDGVQYYTGKNQGPNSTIHSGTKGWSYRTWDVEALSRNEVVFKLLDSNFSSKGFPGDVLAFVRYRLGPETLTIRIEAYSQNHRTPLMPTNHAYWNLDAFANPDDDTVYSHTLEMPESTYLVLYDGVGEPNGTFRSIDRDSRHDYWSHGGRVIRDALAYSKGRALCNPGVPGYDCAYAAEKREVSPETRLIASLRSDFTGIGWEMYSNQAALAMTTCGFFPNDTFPIKKTQGASGFVAQSGCIAVEPSDWISGISGFPYWDREQYQIYGPESDTYVNEIVYKFGAY